MSTSEIQLKRKEDEIILRPISTEDAQKWYDFIMQCSKRTIYTRYHHAKQFSQEEIRDFCEVDPEGEIAYIAEIKDGDSSKIVGEVRLYRFENNTSLAEFAIMVADNWQSRGIGTQMTTQILKVAKQIGIRKIVAYTESDNHKMLSVFKKLGFDRNTKKLDQTVDLSKLLVD